MTLDHLFFFSFAEFQAARQAIRREKSEKRTQARKKLVAMRTAALENDSYFCARDVFNILEECVPQAGVRIHKRRPHPLKVIEEGATCDSVKPTDLAPGSAEDICKDKVINVQFTKHRKNREILGCFSRRIINAD